MNTRDNRPQCATLQGPLGNSGKIAVISNPTSGHNRDNFDRVSGLLESCAGIRHYVTESETDLPEVLRSIAASGPKILAINGGDGTVAAIFAHLLEHTPFRTPPRIILLPGGTANMTAGDVGVKGSLIRATERLCDWCQGKQTREYHQTYRYILRVQHQDRIHYGMFFGAGAIIQGTEYAHSKIHSRGLRDDFSVGLGAVRTLWGMVRGDEAFDCPLPVQLRIGDESNARHLDIRILAVSTLEQLFMGFHPFWGEEDGAVKASLITRGAGKLLLRFPGILRGRPSKGARRDPGYSSFNTSRLELGLDGSFNLDGEVIAVRQQDGPVTITAAGPLTFVKLS